MQKTPFKRVKSCEERPYGVYRPNEKNRSAAPLHGVDKETGKVGIMAKSLACTKVLQNALLHMEQGNVALADSNLKALEGCPCDKKRNQNCAYADDCAVQDVIEGFYQLHRAVPAPAPASPRLARAG